MSKIDKGTKRKACTDEAKCRDDNDTTPCIEKRDIIASPQKKCTSKSLRKREKL